MLGLAAWTASAQTPPATQPDSSDLSYLGPYPGDRTPSPAAPAAAEAAPGEWFGSGKPWWEWSRATGDWDGVRTNLESLGLSFGGSYRSDLSTILSGGLRQRVVLRGLLDVNMTFDPKELLGIEGVTFFAQYYYRPGPNGSDDAGALQAYDNLDSPRFGHAEEVWYEQKLLGDRLRLKAGQVDANAEFDFVSAAGEFINSSAGFSPTMVGFCTYPEPAISANVFVYPVKWAYAGAGYYTENLDDISASSFRHPLLIGETGLTHSGAERLGPGRVAAGFWNNHKDFERFDGGGKPSTYGFFAVAEQQVWKKVPGDASDTGGISVFAQYGTADGNVSAIDRHVGIGMSAAGMIPGRANDAFGVYGSWLGTSRATGSPFDRNESTVEWFYRLQLTPFFSLKPDLQWIQNPGGQSSPGTTWAGTVRAMISF